MRFLEMHIETADLQRAVDFYTRLLPHHGLIHWKDGSAVALVFDDGTAFGIWQRGKFGLFKGQGAEHLHFAFQTTRAELDSFRARLVEMGVETFEHVWENGELSLYFFDPDGHQGEFMTKDWLGRPS